MRIMKVGALIIIVALIGHIALAKPRQKQLPMDQMIQQARTAEDHEAIAARYNAMAFEAQAVSNEHVKMAAAYKILNQVASTKTHRPYSDMISHCTRLVSSYAADAKLYQDLAALHRHMAEDLRVKAGSPSPAP